MGIVSREIKYISEEDSEKPYWLGKDSNGNI